MDVARGAGAVAPTSSVPSAASRKTSSTAATKTLRGIARASFEIAAARSSCALSFNR